MLNWMENCPQGLSSMQRTIGKWGKLGGRKVVFLRTHSNYLSSAKWSSLKAYIEVILFRQRRLYLEDLEGWKGRGKCCNYITVSKEKKTPAFLSFWLKRFLLTAVTPCRFRMPSTEKEYKLGDKHSNFSKKLSRTFQWLQTTKADFLLTSRLLQVQEAAQNSAWRLAQCVSTNPQCMWEKYTGLMQEAALIRFHHVMDITIVRFIS